MKQRNYTSKMISFYVILFAFVPAMFAKITVDTKVGSMYENYNTCLTEIEMTENDAYTIGDILHDRHKQPENQERQRKNGCLYHCMLQKANAIEDSVFNVEKLRTTYTQKTNNQPGSDFYKAWDNCVGEAKDIPDKCDKSLALTTCYVKAKEKILSEKGEHTPSANEEHEHEQQ